MTLETVKTAYDDEYDEAPGHGRIDYVVFDLGGVVFRWTDALGRLADRIGADAAVSQEQFRAAYSAPRSDYDRTSDEAAYWSAVAAGCGAPLPSRSDIDELTAIDLEGWSHSDPDMLALIDEIAASGTGLAILSNAPATMGDHVRSRPWASAFGHIVMSGEIGLMKPDEEIFRYLLRQLQTPPERVVFTDDLAANISGATSTGIAGIQYTGVSALRRHLASFGVPLGTGQSGHVTS